jgi:hypothetical protein
MRQTKKRMIISLPNIDEEMAEALLSFSKDGLEIVLLVEINEQSYRTGFGEIGALEKLKASKVILLDKRNINVYFYIFDDIGFFHFPKSRYEEAEGVSYDLVPMVASQINELKILFNLTDEDTSITDEVMDSFDAAVLKEVKTKISVPVEKKLNALIDKIKKDHPYKPDHSRLLNVYKYKFQFVELKFKGANLHIKKVKIPRNALPFKDATLKKDIEANLRLFTDLPEKDFMKPFFDLKQDQEAIRSKFLVYLKERDKNLIKRDDKETFIQQLKDINTKVADIKAKLINNIQAEINNSRYRIKNSLLNFLTQNPLDEFEGLYGETLHNELINYTNKVVSRIHFPTAKNILNDLSFEWHFYDITWEDLQNQKVLDEMLLKQLIKKGEKAFIEETAIGTTTN